MTRPILDFEKAWAVWKTVSDRYNGKMDNEADEAMNVELERQAQASTQPLLAEIETQKALTEKWAREHDKWYGELIKANAARSAAEAKAQRLREALTGIVDDLPCVWVDSGVSGYCQTHGSVGPIAECRMVKARKALGGSK